MIRLVSIVAVISLCGCVPTETSQHAGASQQQQNGQTSDESKADRLAVFHSRAFLEKCVEVKSDDATLVPSAVIPVTGDLRPLWRVSGRVHTCSHDITDLTLSIEVYKVGTDDELDSTELTLKGTIPANSTRGFEEDVHLRIPRNGWWWYIGPLKGQVDPAVVPLQQ